MHPILSALIITLVMSIVLMRTAVYCIVLGRTWNTDPKLTGWISRWFPATALAAGFGLAPLTLGIYLHRTYPWAHTLLEHATALWLVPIVFGGSMALLFILHGRQSALSETSDLETSPTS